MKKLHLLVIKSFIGPLILTFFFVVFILLMQFLWKYIDDLIGKGLEFSIIGEFLVYTSATLVPLAIPLAVLLASLMTFGNLAENLELLAFKSSGISLIRIMNPVIILSALIAIGAFFFSNTILPYSNLKMRSLLYDIQQQRPELTIKPGVFDNGLEGYSIRIGERDQKTSLLRDILIFDHTEKHGNTNVTLADSGYMRMSADEKHLLLTLYNGKSYVEMQKHKKENRHIKSYPFRRDYFEHREIVIELTGFGLNRSDEKLFRNSYSMLNLDQLHHFQDSLGKDLNVALDKFYTTVDKTLTGKSKNILIKKESKKPEEDPKRYRRLDEEFPPPRPLVPDSMRAALGRPEVSRGSSEVSSSSTELSGSTEPSGRPEVSSDRPEVSSGRITTDLDSLPGAGAAIGGDSSTNLGIGAAIGRDSAAIGGDSAAIGGDSASISVAGVILMDTVPEIRILPLHVDSLFGELDKMQKRRAITQALSFARSNKSVVSSNVGTAEWKTTRLRRYQIEIHRKYTYSLLVLIFFFIGAPLGAIIRKGGLGMPVIASVLMFLFYYVISMTGEKFARENVMPPEIGMWLSTFILVPISVWLTYKAANDSVVLNIETYFTFFKKLGQRYNDRKDKARARAKARRER